MRAAAQTIETLKETGFVVVEHGISPDAVDELVCRYAEFTDGYPDPEPATMNAMITDVAELDELDYSKDEQTEWHKYRTSHPQLGKPGGYTNRSAQIAALAEFDRDQLPDGTMLGDDPKEFYHYHPNSLGIIQDFHDEHDWMLPREVTKLHESWEGIHSSAIATLRGILSAIEDTHPELLSEISPPKIFNNSPSRLLFYHPGQGDVLAAKHVDKSLGTLQIAESHHGLRVQNNQTGEMEEIVRPPEKGIVFVGGTLAKAFPETPFTAGYHDVLNIPISNEKREIHGKNVARWALILFSNSHYTAAFTKAMSHA